MASREWMLHEHHDWKCLVIHHGTRAEFESACEDKIEEAVDNSSDSPCLFDRAEFLAADYYQDKFAEIKPDTTHVLTVDDRGGIEQFSNKDAAQKAYDAARRDHGSSRLTCDRGGHQGATERVDVSHVRIIVTAPSGVYGFDFKTAEEEIENEAMDDAGVPESDREDVRWAVNGALADIAAE